MSSRSIFYLIIIVLCMSLASAALTSLVPNVCKDISRADPTNICYDFCVSALGSDPRSPTSTALQLAEISFELCVSRAKVISSSIGKLLEHSVPDPPDKDAMKVCFGVYSTVPGDLNLGLKALKGGDYDTASSHVRAATNAAATCRHEIKEKRGNIGPLTQEITAFHQLGAISLGFTNLLRIIN